MTGWALTYHEQPKRGRPKLSNDQKWKCVNTGIQQDLFGFLVFSFSWLSVPLFVSLQKGRKTNWQANGKQIDNFTKITPSPVTLLCRNVTEDRG